MSIIKKDKAPKKKEDYYKKYRINDYDKAWNMILEGVKKTHEYKQLLQLGFKDITTKEDRDSYVQFHFKVNGVNKKTISYQIFNRYELHEEVDSPYKGYHGVRKTIVTNERMPMERVHITHKPYHKAIIFHFQRLIILAIERFEKLCEKMGKNKETIFIEKLEQNYLPLYISYKWSFPRNRALFLDRLKKCTRKKAA